MASRGRMSNIGIISCRSSRGRRSCGIVGSASEKAALKNGARFANLYLD